MAITPRKILIISNATDLPLELLSQELLSYGFELITAEGVEAAQQWLAVQGLPHLMIIDLHISESAGLEFIREVYQQAGMPIIVISSNSVSTEDALRALQFADDFIRREFVSSKELSLRIRRVLSRIQNFSYASGPEVRIDDGLFVDHVNRQFKAHGEVHKLTPLENALLTVLLAHRGQVVDAGSLIERVWRIDPTVRDRNALRVHLHRLRQKIEPDPDNPQLILTVRGIGYSLVDSSM